jgi:H+-transporting ATPase
MAPRRPVTLLFGSQGLIYVLRERHRIWSSMPSKWVFASSAVDIGIVTTLALSGTVMAPLPWTLLLTIAVAAAAFALLLDQLKRLVMAVLRIE